MEIGKKYTSRTGAIRTPLSLSECGRFVTIELKYKSGKTVIVDHWKIIFEERVQKGSKIWNQ